ncbi:MAG: SCO family protein [Deltaproteobacteria bacterium]|nr:MAG: SCO family protein [Deltaproteobacteria bacterium]
MRNLIHIIVPALLVALASPADAQRTDFIPEALQGVDVDERLGGMVDLDLTFVNAEGESVRLRDFVRDGRPILLTLNYYDCPMLCDLQLNAVVDTLSQLRENWVPGNQFELVTISFDPEEGPELAAGKQRAYRASLGRGSDAGWHFLVGDRENIDALTEQLGYMYQFIEEAGEFSHPSVLMFLSPEGRITRYLYGLMYDPQDVRLALLEASEGRVGSPMERIILSCFIYDPDRGAYIPYAFGIMRIAGAVTVFLILVMLLVLWRREQHEPVPTAA